MLFAVITLSLTQCNHNIYMVSGVIYQRRVLNTAGNAGNYCLWRLLLDQAVKLFCPVFLW